MLTYYKHNVLVHNIICPCYFVYIKKLTKVWHYFLKLVSCDVMGKALSATNNLKLTVLWMFNSSTTACLIAKSSCTYTRFDTISFQPDLYQFIPSVYRIKVNSDWHCRWKYIQGIWYYGTTDLPKSVSPGTFVLCA